MMKRFLVIGGLCLGTLLAGGTAFGDPPADNTGNNKRDRAKNEDTADQQKNKKSDLEITRLIRRAIVKEKTMSTYAKNIKIITQAGAVTLKGPVRTEDEKTFVEARAIEVAGQDNVTSQIEIAPKK